MRVLSLALLLLALGCTSFEVADELETVTATRMPNLAIPDDSDVGVTDIAGIDRSCTIASAELDIVVRHPFRGDLFIELTSPGGTLRILQRIDDNDDNANLVGTYPTTLVPVQPLDSLAGEEGNGIWTLKVSDLGEGDVGTLESWTIRLGCL